MISFKINNEALDLNPGQTIPIEWESGLFGDVILGGLGTLPINLPFTDKNKRLLQYFNIVNNQLNNVTLNCDIYLADNLWAKGQMIVNVKGENFDCDWSEINPIASAADLKLSEIFDDNDFEEIITKFTRWWFLYFAGNTATAFFRVDFYINNVLYRYDSIPYTGVNFDDCVNDIYNQIIIEPEITNRFNVFVDTSPGFIVGIYVEDKAPYYYDSNDNVTVVCDWLLTSPWYGAAVNWAQYQHDEIINFLSASVNDIFPAVPACFPTIKNTEAYSNKNANYANFINNYINAYLGNNNTNKYRNTISPQVFLFQYLRKLFSKFDFFLNGTLNDITDLRRNCFIYSNYLNDLVTIDSAFTASTFANPQVYNIFAARWYYKNQSPDATLADFLAAIKYTFASNIILKNNIVTIDTLNSILTNPNELNLTHKSYRIIDEIDSSLTQGFTIAYSYDGQDEYLSDKVEKLDRPPDGFVATFADLPKQVKKGLYFVVNATNMVYYSTGASLVTGSQLIWEPYGIYLHNQFILRFRQNTINTNHSPTVNDWHQDDTRRILLPHIYQTCTSPEFTLGENPPQVRFMLYMGSKEGQTNTGSNEAPNYVFNGAASSFIPYASMDNTDMQNNVVLTHALRLNGQYGLYNMLHKNWIDFLLRTKFVKVQAILSFTDLLQLNITGKVRIDESVFLIDKIRGNISQREDSINVTLDMYKM